MAEPGVASRPGVRGVALRRFPALGHDSFRLYATGLFFFSIAQMMFRVAVAWLVYALTRAPLNVALMLGVLGFCRTAPIFVCVLPAGVATDRIGPRRMMLLTNGCATVIAAVFALLAAMGWLNVWLVLAATLLIGASTALRQPAGQAIVRDLVGVQDLHNGIAVVALIQNIVQIAAPLAAGVLLVYGNGALVLAMVAAGSGMMLLMLLLIEVEHTPVPHAPMLHSLGEVFAYIKAEPLVKGLILLETIPGFFALPYTALLPIYAGSIYGRGAAGLGVMQSMVGIGALTGSIALVVLANVSRKGVLLIVAIASFGGSLILFALVHVWPVALLMLVLIGMFDALYILTINGLLLERAPIHLRGRVMSVFTLADSGMSPLGSVVSGGVAGILGAPAALAINGGIVMACVGAVTARVPGLRRV